MVLSFFWAYAHTGRTKSNGRKLGYDRGVIGKGVAISLAALAFAPSAGTVNPPSRPGPWKQLGKAVTSRLSAKAHMYKTAVDMKALAFVVASRSPRRIHLYWTSYCEEQSDDGYTEDHAGKLSGVGRVTYYPQVFDGATLCYVTVSTDAIKGARVVTAVFSY
jgi:hypothetical protein